MNLTYIRAFYTQGGDRTYAEVRAADSKYYTHTAKSLCEFRTNISFKV